HHPEISLKVAQKGLGNITETDVAAAESSGAWILAFHVKPTTNAQSLARDKQVAIREYKVIYDLINDVKKELQALLGEERIETEIGRVEVLAIFREDQGLTVAGGKVLKGKVAINGKVKVLRSDIEIGE